MLKMMYFPAFKLSEVYSVGGILIYMGMKQFMLHLSGAFKKFYNLGLLVAFIYIYIYIYIYVHVQHYKHGRRTMIEYALFSGGLTL